MRGEGKGKAKEREREKKIRKPTNARTKGTNKRREKENSGRLVGEVGTQEQKRQTKRVRIGKRKEERGSLLFHSLLFPFPFNPITPVTPVCLFLVNTSKECKDAWARSHQSK